MGKKITEFDPAGSAPANAKFLFEDVDGIVAGDPGQYYYVDVSNLPGGAAAGDMSKSTYDPTNVFNDAFDMDNMAEGITKLILTGAERTAIINNSAKISNATHTGHVTGATNLTIANSVITAAMLNTLGTPDGTKFLRDDFTWITVPTTGLLLASNNLSDVANALTATQNLNVEIGVDVQAYDATLQTISGLIPSANQMIYYTAPDAAALTTISSFARDLLDDGNAAAMQTTLGVDPSGTDNSTDVTLAGAPDYITISGQVITRNLIDLSTDVTDDLPLGNLAQAGAWTLALRNAATTGDLSYTKISALTDRTSFGTGDKLIIEESTGELRKIDYDDLSAGTVSKTGTPVDNQVAIWWNETTIEGNPFVTFDGSTFKISGLGTGALTAYDLAVGDVDVTPTYGIIRMGNSIIGRTSYNVANLDLDGTVLVRNVGTPATSNIEFAWGDSSNSIRFALAKGGVGNATYSARSMLIAGPAVLDDTICTVGYWQTNNSIFGNLACDTGTTGADLGVQNDLEVEGDIFTDSIKGSTANTTIAIAPNGTGNVSLGNFVFDVDQTIGPSQDNYVLTYDHGTGFISLEVGGGGGAGNVSNTGTPADSQIPVWTDATTIEGTANLTYDGTTFDVGNYSFNVDETVGAGQDNYVLKYDNTSGEIRLEAEAGGGGGTDIEAWIEISSETLSGDGNFAAVTIPAGYDELEVQFNQCESDRTAAATDQIWIEINDDTTAANYEARQLIGITSTSVSAWSGSDRTVGHCSAATDTGKWGTMRMRMYNVGTTAKETSWETTGGGGGIVGTYGGTWENTAVITKLEFSVGIGTNFKSGSQLKVYGRKTVNTGAGGGGGGGTDIEALIEIATETLSSDSNFASVTIPAGYDAIDVDLYVESDRSANLDDIEMTINSDTTDANYTRYRSYVTGSSTLSGGNAEDRSIGIIPAANLTGELGLTKLELRGVSDTGVNTHWRCIGGGAGAASTSSGEWSSTSVVTSIAFAPLLGTNFKSGSKITVYGQKTVNTGGGGGSGHTIGTDDQIPYVDAAGTDMDYSADFTYDGTSFLVNTIINSMLSVTQSAVIQTPNDSGLMLGTDELGVSSYDEDSGPVLTLIANLDCSTICYDPFPNGGNNIANIAFGAGTSTTPAYAISSRIKAKSTEGESYGITAYGGLITFEAVKQGTTTMSTNKVGVDYHGLFATQSDVGADSQAVLPPDSKIEKYPFRVYTNETLTDREAAVFATTTAVGGVTGPIVSLYGAGSSTSKQVMGELEFGTGRPAQSEAFEGRVWVKGVNYESSTPVPGVSMGGGLEVWTTAVGSATDSLAFSVSEDRSITGETTAYLLERSAALGDRANYGQLWVKDDTPCTLWFTNDTGTDTQLGVGGGSSAGISGTPADNQLAVWVSDTAIEGNNNLLFNSASGDFYIGNDAISDMAVWIGDNNAAWPTPATLNLIGRTGEQADILIESNATGGAAGSVIWYPGPTGSTPSGTKLMDYRCYGKSPNVHAGSMSVYANAAWSTGPTYAPAEFRFKLYETGVGEVIAMTLGSDSDADYDLTLEHGSFFIGERTVARTDKAGYGQLWVKDTLPCELWFTDDNGTDTQLGTGGGGGGLPVADTTSVVKGSADGTKLLRFEVDGFTTATTRVLTPPDADGTLVLQDLAQTLTNKTLTDPVIAKIVSVSAGDIWLAPDTTGDVKLGNLTIDADLTVGSGQDNYVLKYDHASGKMGLEPDLTGGGGVAFGAENTIPTTNAGLNNFDYDSDFTYDGTDLQIGVGSIYVGERANAGADTAGWGQFWVKLADSKPWFTDDSGNDQILGDVSSDNTTIIGGVPYFTTGGFTGVSNSNKLTVDFVTENAVYIDNGAGLVVGDNSDTHRGIEWDVLIKEARAQLTLVSTNASNNTTSACATIDIIKDDGAALGAGHFLGELRYSSVYDIATNTVYVGAAITATSQDTWSSTSAPTEMQFWTTDTNAISPTVAAAIRPEGSLRLENGSNLLIEEASTRNLAYAGFGGIWVKDDTPCTLWFTDDTGADSRLDNQVAQTGVGWSIMLNNSASTTTLAPVKISALTDRAALGSGDKLIIEESTGELRKIDYDDLPGAGGGISNIVQDTTPQLGGMLDVNTYSIGDGTLELLSFSETASAVNEFTIANAATTNAPVLSATGTDTNIGITLTPKGTGNITLGTMEFDSDQTIGAGQNNYVMTYDDATGEISLEPAQTGSLPVADSTVIVEGSVDTSKKLRFEIDGFTTATTRVMTLPDADGTAVYEGATQTLTGKTLTSPVISQIVSVSNGDIDIQPNGTGNVLLGNYEFDVDQTVGAGEDGYILTYNNGTGHVSLAAGSTPPDTQAVVKGSADATKLLRFEVDGFTTSNTRVLTPPDSDGTIVLNDFAATLTNKTIDGNQNTLTVLGGSQIFGDIPLSNIAQAGAWTIALNNSASTADIAYVKISSLTDRTAFGSGDKVIIEESTGELRKIDYDDLPGAGGGISSLLQDTTPQLGGMLDVNTYSIGDGTLELLSFSETVSAINEFTIANAAAGNPPVLSATGGDTNIGITLTPKGTGNIKLGTMEFDSDQTIGSGQDDYVLTYDHASTSISLEAATGGGGSTDYTIPPATDHTGEGTTSNDLNAGQTITIMNVVRMASDGKWDIADASTEAGTSGILAIALEGGTDTNPLNVLFYGIARDDTWNWTPGATLFLSTTGGAITATAPTVAAETVRVVGTALTADVIFFNPSPDYVVLT